MFGGFKTERERIEFYKKVIKKELRFRKNIKEV